MIATTRQCLSLDELQSLLSGRLDAVQLDAAIEHLDRCTTCQSIVQDLESQAFESKDLRNLSSDNLLIESACQVAIGRLLHKTPLPLAQHHNVPVTQKRVGPYTILDAIGVGGMGMVYLAQHERLKRKCAIKFLPQTRVTDAGWLERFDREMTTIAALEHPNIVRATDAGHEDGWHYLVMEFLDGLDVGKIASRLKKVQVADACRVVSEAALGLAYVHEKGLVHRDVKPSNLMLTTTGNVKLLDLGLVLAGDDPLAVHDRLTTAGHFMGTMPFMSPEQLLDSRHVDPASDMYSLGATLYRLIAGRVPHANRHGLASQVLAITHEPPTPLDEAASDIDPELSSFVGRLLSRDPKRRPTANEAAHELKRWSGGADLVRLVHRASQQPETDMPEGFTSGWPIPTLASPPRRTWPRWVAVGLAAAGFTIAAVIFKIQTERGELVIESEADDVTVLVMQGDTMIEKLQIELGDDNRVSLRQGTYTIEIDGASNGLRLDNNRVFVEGDRPTKVGLHKQLDSKPRVDDVVSSEKTRLQEKDAAPELQRTYQGHPYSYWFDILNREQDAKTLSSAMQAVEILTRETPQRGDAAKATMKLADRLGGIVIGGEDPSAIYMDVMRELYPNYLPEPGLESVVEALQSDDPESHMAASWILTDYLSGYWNETVWPERIKSAHDYLKSDGSSETKPWAKIRELLAAIDNAYQRVSSTSPAVSVDLDLIHYVRQMLFDSGSELVELASPSIEIPTWMEKHVQEQVDKATKTLEAASWETGERIGFEWLMKKNMVNTAIRLHREKRIDVSPKLIATILVAPQFYASDKERITLLKRFNESFEGGVIATRQQIRTRIEKITTYDWDEERWGGASSGGTWMTNSANPESEMSQIMVAKQEFWEFALEILANDEDTTTQSLDVLKKFANAKMNGSGKAIVPDSLRVSLEVAMKNLEAIRTSQ